MKLWLRRIAALLWLLAGLAIALAAGALTCYFVSPWTANILLITLAGLCVLAATSFVAAMFDARIWHIERRLRFAGWLSGILTVCAALALHVLILRPSSLPHGSPIARSSTRYWDLPTGSHIAHSEYDPPPGVPRISEPIVFLHGGPGVFTFDFDHEFFKQFAADGFRVYLFDQAGSGLSGYLPHVRDYTLTRSIEDLEEVRRQIGASKLILIGHSWGATLAANYMTKYPEHVWKVVLLSPGPIWNLAATGQFDFDRTDAHPSSTPLRLIAGALLFRKNPDAAENLLSQREAGDMDRALLDAGAIVCKGALAKLPSIPAGENLYPLLAIQDELNGPERDPHRVLRENRTPAMVAYAECDFLTWSNVLDYRKTFPNLKIYYFPRAGHYIQLMQPELLRNEIRAFLLDQPDVIPPHQGEIDPRTTAPVQH